MVKTRVGYEANPNGNLWLKDNTGFGQKMLAKMGWKEGQGLGRAEQGITEAIRVSRKRDNRGVGCSRQWAEEGSAQMDAFSAVLADLNRQHDSPAAPEEADADQPVGLEESSRRSRNRLHYAKFTRGKDLSRCSEQALLSIMGPRGVPQEKEKAEAETEAEAEAEAKAEDLGVRHVQSSLSTAEYFAQKMEAMRARLKASASAPHLCEKREEETREEEEEEAFSARPTFQLGGDISDDLEDGEISQQSPVISTSLTNVEIDDADDEGRERKRRKEERKRRRKERENAETEDCVQEQDQEVLSTEKEKEERRRRKEERRRRRKERENAEMEDCVEEEDQEVLSTEKEEKEERRRRKEERKRRKEQENAEMEDCVEEEDQEVLRAENEEKEDRRRRKEERRRKRRERYTTAEAEEKEEGGKDEDEMSSKQKQNERVEETMEALLSAKDSEDTSKRKRREEKKRKNRGQSSESEEEVQKKRKVRPSSATMTKEEAASFAAENEEIMQHLEWSAFSTSNLGLVVGYKYRSVS